MEEARQTTVMSGETRVTMEKTHTQKQTSQLKAVLLLMLPRVVVAVAVAGTTLPRLQRHQQWHHLRCGMCRQAAVPAAAAAAVRVVGPAQQGGACLQTGFQRL